MKNKRIGIRTKIGFGISGFTLGIAGIIALLFNPFLSLIFLITGLIFCIIQQRNQKIKLGKYGLIINIIGLSINIIYIIVLIKYLIPLIESQLGNEFIPSS